MTKNETPSLTAEQIAEHKKELNAFYKKVEEVPDKDRVYIESEKFSGPIGTAPDNS